MSTNWALSSSLRQVIFESALSLRIMIETGKVDLTRDFEIKCIDCDCPLDFPGYSVETDQGVEGVVRLVKK
jgi:hypothetical protein